MDKLGLLRIENFNRCFNLSAFEAYCSERRYITARTQYNIFASFPIIFRENCSVGEIPRVVSGGNVRREMKYPEGNVTDPSWADEQAKMLLMPSTLKMQKNLADVSCANHFFPSPSEKAMKISASFTNPWDGRL